MLEKLIDLLAHPEEYECCWHDGELYLRLVVVTPPVAAPARANKLEPA